LGWNDLASVGAHESFSHFRVARGYGSTPARGQLAAIAKPLHFHVAKFPYYQSNCFDFGFNSTGFKTPFGPFKALTIFLCSGQIKVEYQFFITSVTHGLLSPIINGKTFSGTIPSPCSPLREPLYFFAH
jgi:hypothetical protein